MHTKSLIIPSKKTEAEKSRQLAGDHTVNKGGIKAWVKAACL